MLNYNLFIHSFIHKKTFVKVSDMTPIVLGVSESHSESIKRRIMYKNNSVRM